MPVQKFRVETDKGAYEIEVDVPTPAAVMVNGKPMSIGDYNETQQAAPGRSQAAQDAITAHTFYPASGLPGYTEHGPDQIGAGVQNVRQGNYARGAHQIVNGAGVTALPLALPAILGAPVAAGVSAATGYVGSRLARTGAKALRASDDQADLVGDVGGLAGGWMGARGSGPAQAGARRVVQAVQASPVARELVSTGVNVAVDTATGIPGGSQLMRALGAALARRLRGAPGAATGEVIEASAVPSQRALPASTVQEMPASDLPDPSYVRAVPAQYAERETMPAPAPEVPPMPAYDAAARQVTAEADAAALRANGLDLDRGYAAMLARRAGAPKPAEAPVPAPRPPVADRTAVAAQGGRKARSTASAKTPTSASSSAFSPAEEAYAIKRSNQGRTPDQIVEEILAARQLTASTGGLTPEETARAIDRSIYESTTPRGARSRRRTSTASEEP